MVIRNSVRISEQESSMTSRGALEYGSEEEDRMGKPVDRSRDPQICVRGSEIEHGLQRTETGRETLGCALTVNRAGREDCKCGLWVIKMAPAEVAFLFQFLWRGTA